MIENSIRNEPYINEGGVTVVQKAGELLSNMYVVLVNQF